eukprot:scaffold520_cov224-Pinguiococcus_pyrenoidosus.AAC.8
MRPLRRCWRRRTRRNDDGNNDLTVVSFRGRDGKWGGGPEIVALSNALRRPIHVYELLSADSR